MGQACGKASEDSNTQHGSKDSAVPNKRSAEEPVPKDAKKTKTEQPAGQDEHRKPRLTTPELEFDYDRSQLRDPRPTPGRERRPRYEDIGPPDELRQKFENEFEIPKPEKPKGRLDAFQKNELFSQEALINPLKTFHDIHVCHKKGPNGSPTYDGAGFQLDWHKVDDWMKPRPYNKRRAMKGMDRAVDKAEQEMKEAFEIFFVPGHGADKNSSHRVADYVKDTVSKDLGVPWHQIGPQHMKEWEDKGFQKVKFGDWWQEPNEEEGKRMLNMMSGASLRKDL